MISMIERGKSNPSIGTLHAIADALDVSMSELFHAAEPIQDPTSDVVRAIAQDVIETSSGVARRLLIHDPTHGFEMAENRYEAGTASAPAPIYHQGFEFGFLLEGELEVEIGNRVHRLRAGDAIRLESSEPHRFRNRGRHPARTIWVNLAPRSTGKS
jgi:transcriptional regulator with XRE-family HTH domain